MHKILELKINNWINKLYFKNKSNIYKMSIKYFKTRCLTSKIYFTIFELYLLFLIKIITFLLMLKIMVNLIDFCYLIRLFIIALLVINKSS